MDGFREPNGFSNHMCICNCVCAWCDQLRCEMVLKKTKSNKVRLINAMLDTLALFARHEKPTLTCMTHIHTQTQQLTFHLNFHEMIIHQIASHIHTYMHQSVSNFQNNQYFDKVLPRHGCYRCRCEREAISFSIQNFAQFSAKSSTDCAKNGQNHCCRGYENDVHSKNAHRIFLFRFDVVTTCMYPNVSNHSQVELSFFLFLFLCVAAAAACFGKGYARLILNE